MGRFIGREMELKRLLELTHKRSASFIVVKGRRRIGKSRLIEEFSKHFDHYYTFTGLPPKKDTTEEEQIEEFSRQIARQFKTVFARYDNWGDALWSVGERLPSRKILLLFDEISWMGSKDPLFLGKIKNFWDQQLNKSDKLIFVVCGSASGWIEKNILSDTGFVGRISYTLTVEELPLSDCNRFWPKNISAYEKLKILSITGGVPKYLEEIDPKCSAEDNIRRLCFTKGGFLVKEFNQIFSDLFLRKTKLYKKIVTALSTGPKEQGAIAEALKIKRHGRIPEYLWELELAGFVSRDYTWDIKSGDTGKLSRYRLQDNYIHFYLKYIEKNMDKIERETFAFGSITALPEWYCMMGLQFENMVLNIKNRKIIQKFLGVRAEEIICENPYFQRKTNLVQGCQIDYMIQTKFGTLYVCEIKFSKNAITSAVIAEVQEKIDALNCPKGFSCRPVLIHVNGVSQDILDRDYFASIIDIGELLETNTSAS